MKLPKASTVLTLFFIFIFFLVLALPFQNLKGWLFGTIYEQSQRSVLLVADDIYLHLFGIPGIGIKNVSATLGLGPTELELASEKVIVRGPLAGLFPPVLGGSLQMINLKKGGDLFVKGGQSKDKLIAKIEAYKVNLEQLLFSGMQEPFSGILDMDSNLSINSDDLSKSSGTFNVHGDKFRTPNYMVEIPGMPFLIPGMTMGTLDIKGQIKNGNVDLQALKFGSADSDLKGSLTGDIRLGRNYQATYLNIILRLTISKRILESPQNATFLNFLSSYQTAQPGEYAMKWTATINEIMGLSKALPEKVS